MLPKLNNLTLTFKILPLILAGTLVAIAAGFGLLLTQFSEISSNQIQLSQDLLSKEQVISKKQQLQALESKAETLGKFMSAVAIDLILSSDFEALVDYKNSAEKDADIAYAAYLDTELKPYVAFKKPEDASGIIEKKYKIESDGDLLGYILLGITQSHVKTAIAASDKRTQQAVKRVEENADKVYQTFLYIIAIIVVGITVIVVGTVYVSFRKLIISRLQHTTALMNELSLGSGDLTKRLPVPNNDEISQLCASVNKFVSKLQDMVQKISSNVNQLTQESTALEQQGQSLSNHASIQTEEAAVTAASMSKMTVSMQEVAESTESAESMARKADTEAQGGTKVVHETIDTINILSNDITETSAVINSLQQESESIGGVLDVIRGIAEQTNLLALNAAIEAARAGDQGRGFAVVADEVRTLASRTQTATEEINEMIEKLQSGSQKAVTAMNKNIESAKLTVEQTQLADTSLSNIVQAVQTISDMNTQIASAAEGQKSVAESVDQSVSRINSTSQQTAESANNTAEISVRLSTLARDLQGMVGQFKA